MKVIERVRGKRYRYFYPCPECRMYAFEIIKDPVNQRVTKEDIIHFDDPQQGDRITCQMCKRGLEGVSFEIVCVEVEKGGLLYGEEGTPSYTYSVYDEALLSNVDDETMSKYAELLKERTTGLGGVVGETKVFSKLTRHLLPKVTEDFAGVTAMFDSMKMVRYSVSHDFVTEMDYVESLDQPTRTMRELSALGYRVNYGVDYVTNEIHYDVSKYFKELMSSS